MTVNVKAGNPEGVHDNIPGGSTKAIVRDYSDIEAREEHDAALEKKTDALLKEMGADLAVKAGTPKEIHAAIPGDPGKAVVRDYSDNVKVGWYGSTERDGPNYIGKEHAPGFGNSKQIKLTLPQETERSNAFIDQMEKGFSSEDAEETNQLLDAIFESPAYKKAKAKTLGGRLVELGLRFKLLVVEYWLPKGYRVLPPPEPVPDRVLVDLSVELKALALKLWESYEPQLGIHNVVTVLQMEAPPEEDEDGRA